MVRRRRPQKEKIAQATALSVAVHGAIVLLLLWGLREGSVLLANDRAGTGPSATDRAGGGGGGGGAEQVTYYDIPTAPAPPPVPVEATPEDVLPPITPPPPMQQPEPPAERPVPTQPMPTPAPSSQGGAGAGQGGGQGPGSGPGVGPGSGGGSGGGTGGGIGSGTGTGTGGGTGDITPPNQTFLPPFPNPPGSVRRPQDIVLRVTVDTRGRVTRVDLLSSSGDRRFDETLRRWALEVEYEPARDRAGRAVAAQTDLTYQI